MNRTLPFLALIAACGLAPAGCSESQRGTYGPVLSEPLTHDDAMKTRQWEPTPALYANGDTFSWSTGFAYEPTSTYAQGYYVLDSATFFVNLVTLPVTYATEGLHVRYQGVVVPPSYTANPPLPPIDATPGAVTPGVSGEAVGDVNTPAAPQGNTTGGNTGGTVTPGGSTPGATPAPGTGGIGGSLGGPSGGTGGAR